MSKSEKINHAFQLVTNLSWSIRNSLGKEYSSNLVLIIKDKDGNHIDSMGHSWELSCANHPFLTQYQCVSCREYCLVQDGEIPKVLFLCEGKENV